MFQDAIGKKFLAFPSTSLALDSVPYSMRPLPPAAAEVLSSITRHTPVKIVEAERDEDGDWFRLESEDLLDQDVFHRLSNNWEAISGPNGIQFSLIHCEMGPMAASGFITAGLAPCLSIFTDASESFRGPERGHGMSM